MGSTDSPELDDGNFVRTAGVGDRPAAAVAAVEDGRSADLSHIVDAHKPGKNCSGATADCAGFTGSPCTKQFSSWPVHAAVTHSDFDFDDRRRALRASDDRSRHRNRRSWASGVLHRLTGIAVQRKQVGSAVCSGACSPYIPHLEYVGGQPDSSSAASLSSIGEKRSDSGIGGAVRGDQQSRWHRQPARSRGTSLARACGDRRGPTVALSSLHSQQ